MGASIRVGTPFGVGGAGEADESHKFAWVLGFSLGALGLRSVEFLQRV